MNNPTFETIKPLFDALGNDDKLKTLNYLRAKFGLTTPLTIEDLKEAGGLPESDKIAMGITNE